MRVDNIHKKYLGICIGASTISFVWMSGNKDAPFIESVYSKSHEGNPKKLLSSYLEGFDLTSVSVVVTGRKFKNLLKTVSISEAEAIEKALNYLKLNGEDTAVASLGAENFMVYSINSEGNVNTVYTGNKCASGTGEFFLQQLGRMNVNISDISGISNEDVPYFVSGRCSVFCKSDCTHALNKGIQKNNVVLGLSKMIADKAIELLAKQSNKRIIIIGGVSKNHLVLNYIKKEYPELIVPKESCYFEALGAAISSFEHNSKLINNDFFHHHNHQFSSLKPLKNPEAKVIFKKFSKDNAQEGDICIIGLDVGSTTTKAVIIRKKDNAILANEYIRTNGNPIQASIDCYKSLKNQIKVNINIVGIGVTGSGRNIAALHALTDGDINEIIAHSVAASYFDPEVDTIFEIGGQDAKYTHLTGGVASDYAMNEACSAGTGSFLEESAKETLNIYYEDIGKIAFESLNPINFNDQCSAFISSDIKNASHENASVNDIVAGLVYSVCMNFINRVKGNRPVGKKIFMQGGVCYNHAVPYAMSLLIDKEIIVPPEPGLMGAFGVALEIKKRIEIGIYKEKKFNLSELINREFVYKNEFICTGGKEKCDRKCGISVIEIDGKKYPFGGACNKYYNQRHNLTSEPAKHNFVKVRQDMIFKNFVNDNVNSVKIGINKSLLTNSLFPLYYNFFRKIGCQVLLSQNTLQSGKEKARSSYCYPVEISHGMFMDLISQKPDYIFMPHIAELDGHNNNPYNRICVFVQGEKYYLTSAFQELINENIKILNPYLNLSDSYKNIEKSFIKVANEIGIESSKAINAFRYSYEEYNKMLEDFKLVGKKILNELEEKNEKFAFVIFGRPYNAFAEEANLNIPHKLASRDITVIPYDFLPYENHYSYQNMYWHSGNRILSAARYVESNPRLFGVYVTNFSCGPDSFIIPYFRKIMGSKPSLTLELDSHSADVGIDTRIEAAIDIIKNYQSLKNNYAKKYFYTDRCLKFINKSNRVFIFDRFGNESPIDSENVEVIIPSMGDYSSAAFSAVFRSLNIKSVHLPVPTFETVKSGRSITTCKECLPFILTSGSLIEYLSKHSNSNKKILFFMPHGYGPCRQGQYFIRLKDIINNLGMDNVGIISMDDESSFSDFGSDFFTKQWAGLIIADIIHDIDNVLRVLAVDKLKSIKVLQEEWQKIISTIESGKYKSIIEQIEKTSRALSRIPLKMKLTEAKKVSLIGEIYVRREEYSRLDLIHILNSKGFIVKTAPITEYVYYTNYLQKNNIVNTFNLFDKSKLLIKENLQIRIEKKIKKIFSLSGLCEYDLINIEKTMNYGKNLISDKLIGESILTVGLALREILDDACGVISIGPFNCIPSRFAEAILNKEMTLEAKYKYGKIRRNGYPEELSNLPYLHIESDGNMFPQITQSRIEIFMLQAERLHQEMIRLKH